ncbi:MAG: hypothetical protein AAB542_02280 [Patescibacteria group bacterium]
MTESHGALESPLTTQTSEFIALSQSLGAKLFDLTQKNAKRVSADEFIAGLPPDIHRLPLFRGKATLLHQNHPHAYAAPVLRIVRDATTVIQAIHDPSLPPSSSLTQIDQDGNTFRLTPTRNHRANILDGMNLRIGKAVDTDTHIKILGGIDVSVTKDGFAHEKTPLEGISFIDARTIIADIIGGIPVHARLWLRDVKRYGSAPQPPPFDYSRDK